jgi:serine protease Do
MSSLSGPSLRSLIVCGPRSFVRIAGLSILALSLLSLSACQRGESRGSGSLAQSPKKLAPLPPGKYGDFPQIFADVAEGALPAVVSIYTETDIAASEDPADPFENFGAPQGSGSRRESALGSGVIISTDGTILTNNHVIDGATRIQVQLNDGTEYDAEVVGADPPSDLAVIRVKAKGALFPAMPLGESDRLRVGEWVVAVGSPYGLSQTVTTGIISAKGRHNTGINSYENFLQTDAAINPGNSGGALLNLRGELVGINTAIFSRSGGYQGIGFAIPISMARKISNDLIRDGEVTRGWLGVSIQPLDPVLAEALGVKDKRGALVGGIIPGSPAEKAGIRRGDVITRIGAMDVRDANELLNHIALLAPGEWVAIALIRDGKPLVFKAKITRRDDRRVARLDEKKNEVDARLASLGLVVEDMSPSVRSDYDIAQGINGVVVTAVDPDSRAEEAGLQEGDVLVELNRSRLRTLRELQEMLRKVGKSGRILLLVNRGGETFFTAL